MSIETFPRGYRRKLWQVHIRRQTKQPRLKVIADDPPAHHITRDALKFPRFQFRFNRTVHRKIPAGFAKLIPAGLERFSKPIGQLVVTNGFAAEIRELQHFAWLLEELRIVHSFASTQIKFALREWKEVFL